MIYLWIGLLSALLHLLGFIALGNIVRRRSRYSLSTRQAIQASSDILPISVLKPLAGADDSLYANLASLFVQDHPNYQLIFGVNSTTDPAIAVVKRLLEEYPNNNAILVIHSEKRAANPKVNNLLGIEAYAEHDLVVISDSNIRVQPHYLSELAYEYSQLKHPGIISNIIVGCGEKRLGSRLDHLQLHTTIAPAVALSTWAKDKGAIIGKSMCFSLDKLNELGGFQAVSWVLAEDFVIGKMFQQAGLPIRIASTPIIQISQTASFHTFFQRQLRWAQMRSRLLLLSYPFEILVNPWFAPLLAFALGLWLPLLWWFALTIAVTRDMIAIKMLGKRYRMSYSILGTVKDFTMLAVLMIAPFRQRVGWRNNAFQLGIGTQLYRSAVSKTEE